MSPTVGLYGFTGTVGSAILPALVKVHQEGKIKLVILHRESTDLSKLPKDAKLETRVVDLSDAGKEKNKAAVKDLNVVVSTVGAPGLKSQIYIVEALAGSSALKTFIPSDYGANWTEEELKAPGLAGIGVKEEVVKKAKELGVPLTEVRTGLFGLFFFAYKAVGTDVKGNTVQKFRNSLKNPLRLTTLPYLGYAIATLASDESGYSKIANQVLQVYDVTVPGQEIVDTLTKLNGNAPEITEYSEQQYQEDLKGPGAVVAALKAKWGDGAWGPSGSLIEGWKPKSFEELAREAL
ncbi:hypothetical protein CI109_100383 [Kwoniella shandongensis]|uniref:NmrA-like domain-containing protein n=1 Tax=Kwoniella shandongensis TaxID=1734106 RepID=A0A5M6C428_9TREE|nr:uncharacterized protein CI109_001774 [Kwoniella shandongensis]KAA5529834.1 hypothetical protein CI109_001774 [Kwoniella shandongensis]